MVDCNPITIAEVRYDFGFGTHARAVFADDRIVASSLKHSGAPSDWRHDSTARA